MTTEWETEPLTVALSENGTLEVVSGNYEMLTPDGVPFQVFKNDTLFLAFHLTRLESGCPWSLYLTGDVWEKPLTAHGTVEEGTDTAWDSKAINEAVENLLRQVITNPE